MYVAHKRNEWGARPSWDAVNEQSYRLIDAGRSLFQIRHIALFKIAPGPMNPEREYLIRTIIQSAETA